MAQIRYYTDAFGKGPVKYRYVIGSIGVLESPDKFMPIGLANCVTRDENGLGGWTLTVRGDAIPGRWIIVDGEFRRVE
jgi:hypothetical protein